jgi:transmembrane sensor
MKLVAVAASCVLVVGSIAVVALRQDGTAYQTAVGEAQTVVLADGTRMFLNTDTHVRVDLGSKQRTVKIEGGEVAFEVAKEVARPFVVRAAASEVVALGTAFSVRFKPSSGEAGESLTVTLLEGKVSVRPVAGGDGTAVAPAQTLVMQPGERVRLAKAPGRNVATRQELDHPRLDQVTAWKRNEAVFDRTSLGDAVAEMNRYSRTPLVLVGDLARAEWVVSGQFRTGDIAGFAKALAALHGLVVQERDGRVELSQGS